MTFENKIEGFARKNNFPYLMQTVATGGADGVLCRRARFDGVTSEGYYYLKAELEKLPGLVVEGRLDTKRVAVFEEKEYEEYKRMSREYKQNLNDWWQRYHDADEQTRRLMASGEIQ